MGFFDKLRNKFNDSLENYDANKAFDKIEQNIQNDPGYTIFPLTLLNLKKKYNPLFNKKMDPNYLRKENDTDNKPNDDYDWKEDSSHPVHKK
jgi:hypothetical protein